MERLLKADGRGLLGQPLAADEILTVGRETFEPLFHEPPVGPIPEYLDPHGSWYGCVAEYEEKLEELDRWKALELSRWMKERVGREWCVGGKVYELQAEQVEGAASEKFWFRSFEVPTECGKLSSDESG